MSVIPKNIITYICGYSENLKRTTNIPFDVLNTGNLDIIKNCLANNKTLTPEDRRFLEKRIEVIDYVNEKQNEIRGTKLTPAPAVVNAKGANLAHLRQVRQTSKNGCWSMPVYLMLQSRGLDIPQEVIRAYRPDIPAGKNDDPRGEIAEQLNKDIPGNINQASELIHKLVPNTVLKQKTYGADHLGIPTPNALNVYAADFKKTVENAIKTHGSPVSILYGSHYRTIVGIEGNTIVYKDSSATSDNAANNEIRKDISQLLKDATSVPPYAVEIAWLEDLKLKKDSGKPDISEYTGKYTYIKESPDGKLSINSNDYIHATSGINNPLAQTSYQDDMLFQNSLKLNNIVDTGEPTAAIGESSILPTQLVNNVKVLPAENADVFKDYLKISSDKAEEKKSADISKHSEPVENKIDPKETLSEDEKITIDDAISVKDLVSYTNVEQDAKGSLPIVSAAKYADEIKKASELMGGTKNGLVDNTYTSGSYLYLKAVTDSYSATKRPFIDSSADSISFDDLQYDIGDTAIAAHLYINHCASAPKTGSRRSTRLAAAYRIQALEEAIGNKYEDPSVYVKDQIASYIADSIIASQLSNVEPGSPQHKRMKDYFSDPDNRNSAINNIKNLPSFKDMTKNRSFGELVDMYHDRKTYTKFLAETNSAQEKTHEKKPDVKVAAADNTLQIG